MAHQPGKWMAGAIALLAFVQPGSALAQAFADRPIRAVLDGAFLLAGAFGFVFAIASRG